MLSSARFSIASWAVNSLIEYVQNPSFYHKYADEKFNDDKFTSTLLTARLAFARKVIFSFINLFKRFIRLLIVSIISSRKLERAFPSLKILTKLILFLYFRTCFFAENRIPALFRKKLCSFWKRVQFWLLKLWKIAERIELLTLRMT